MQRPAAVVLALTVLATACGNPPQRTSPTPDPKPAPRAEAEPASEAPVLRDLLVREASRESAFDSNAWNSSVGLSGGAGGKFGGRAGHLRMETSAESYAAIEASGFVLPSASPLSTFGADVDTASFTNVHRMLREGRLPPTAAVRVEEFVNACRYELPEPGPRETFAVDTEIAACPWQPGHELVRFSLRTASIDAERLPPCNFVFLLDVSGSMSSADKLPLLKQASDLLVEQLRPQDRVSIVTYARGVQMPLDSASGADKGRIREAIQALQSSGGTNGQGGIQQAYELAIKNKVQGVNRVLLATDGDFNVGISQPDELERFIAERKDEGVFLTVLGFGTGNLKDDRLERLADRGNGAYHYIDTLHTARRVLVEEFGASMMTVAKDVKLQTEWNPDLVASYRLLGYENRTMAAKDFRDDEKDGGEMGAGHAVTALYEIERTATPNGGAEAPLVTLRIRYKPTEGDTAKEVAHEVHAAPTTAELTGNGATAAAAAATAMLLRDDAHPGSISPALLRELVQGVDAARNAELVALVAKACELSEREADAAPPSEEALGDGR